MNIEDTISVIIPVHNGEKYISHLYNSIKKQSFTNLEIIFVENYSKDNSITQLMTIAKRDSRVTVLESKKPGTSMARKMGVEYSTGKYIVFMDQDDKYINSDALKMMRKTIVETNASICQFSNYKQYLCGIKKISRITNNRRIVSVREVLEREIGSMFESYGGGVITPSVWSKIYTASVLKDAVKRINIPLYYAEDLFLNTCCFCSDKFDKICIDPNAYYVWDTRYGFSGLKDSGMALIKDYNVIKPLIHQFLVDSRAGEEVIYRLHLESLYYMVAYLKSNFNEKDLSFTYDMINEISSMPFVQFAKKYVNNEMDDKRQYEELMFLASDYTPEEFYDRFKSKDFQSTKPTIIKSIKQLFSLNCI